MVLAIDVGASFTCRPSCAAFLDPLAGMILLPSLVSGHVVFSAEATAYQWTADRKALRFPNFGGDS